MVNIFTWFLKKNSLSRKFCAWRSNLLVWHLAFLDDLFMDSHLSNSSLSLDTSIVNFGGDSTFQSLVPHTFLTWHCHITTTFHHHSWCCCHHPATLHFPQLIVDPSSCFSAAVYHGGYPNPCSATPIRCSVFRPWPYFLSPLFGSSHHCQS